MSGCRPVVAAAAVGASLSIITLGACGGSGGPTNVTGTSALSILHGSIRLADCSDWNRGPDSSRKATILRLRSFYGSEVTAGNPGGPHTNGPVLRNQQAYELFRRYCAQSFAAAFKLYKLYGRAAGFAGSAP